MPKKNPNLNSRGDYILRWKLSPSRKKRRSKDPFCDFIRDLLRELLDITALTYKGKDVKVDGFHFLNSVDIKKLYK